MALNGLLILHYDSTGSEVLVNPSQISLVNNLSGRASTVWLIDGTQFSVRESVEEIRTNIERMVTP